MLRIRGAKILLTAHNILPHENPKRYFNIHKRIYKIVDLIIVHTENTKLEMIDLFSLSAEKIKVIKHGVFELDYSEIAIADGEKKEIQQIYSKKKKVISFLGRLSQQKGINLTIDFLRLHSHEYPEYTFVIAGAGHVPKLKDIERLDNVVIFNKELSDRMFAKLIELSSFILLPYKKTSQSGLLLTSIGAQKPVITTRLPNFLEAFKISNMGILIEQADINGLKQAVDSSLEFDPTDINWNKLKNYYSWSEIGKQYDQLYKSSGSISDNKL